MSFPLTLICIRPVIRNHKAKKALHDPARLPSPFKHETKIGQPSKAARRYGTSREQEDGQTVDIGPSSKEDNIKISGTGSFAAEPPVCPRQVVMCDADVLVYEKILVAASLAYSQSLFSVEVEVEV